MTEKKPIKSPKAWRGAKGMEHYGEMQPVKYTPRPNLLMRIGSRFFEKLTGK